MIIKPLAAEQALGGDGITTARLVRLVNTTASPELVTIANAQPVSLTIAGNTVEIVEKEVGAVVGGAAGVLAVPVAFTN